MTLNRRHGPRLVAVCGLSRAGKDVFIDGVHEAMPEGSVMDLAWSDPVKAAAMRIFGFQHHQAHGLAGFDRDRPYFVGTKKSVRDALRAIGMMGREMDPDIWVNKLLESVRVASRSYPQLRLILVSGTRFPNELKVCDESVYIHRPGLAPDDHVSETSIAPGDCDEVILNDGTIQDLYKQARRWSEDFVVTP